MNKIQFKKSIQLNINDVVRFDNDIIEIAKQNIDDPVKIKLFGKHILKHAYETTSADFKVIDFVNLNGQWKILLKQINESYMTYAVPLQIKKV